MVFKVLQYTYVVFKLMTDYSYYHFSFCPIGFIVTEK